MSQPPEHSTPGLLGRLQDVANRVREATAAAGRPADSVRVLLATKTIAPPVVLEAIGAGFGLIGENRAQEVVAKADELAASGLPYECHFIGHLQRNKINQVLPHVSCIHTVDSVDLAERLDARLASSERQLDVLLQVNVSGESSKSGLTIAEVPALLQAVAELPRLRVTGYMTIGLNSPDLGAVRAGYRSLTAFRDEALARGLAGADRAIELSMGMSGDFAEAIAEGATIVRVGSAVFGNRPPIVPGNEHLLR
jgi:pyridoxal phosphate enzyme (YggS family)